MSNGIQLLFDYELTDTQARYIEASLSAPMLIKIKRMTQQRDIEKVCQTAGMVMCDVLTKLGVE